MRESEIENYAVKRVKEAGGEIRKCRWIGRNGAPDRRIMLPWLQCWIEFKAPGKKPGPHQYREHARMRRLGEDVRVIDTKEKVDALFEKL